jgi:flagellar biosynthesis chaperone FliJ
MAIFISKIKLTNWFNFKGDPSEETGKNIIVFNNGLNIVVGDNNGGKTKLHNALRFVVSDMVILDKGNNKHELCSVAGNENEIMNNDTFLRDVKENDTVKFGVELSFKKVWSNGNAKDFLLKKYILGRKEARSSGKDIFHTTNVVSKAFEVDAITKSPIERVGDFDKIKNQLLSPAYMNFFLVEGEQIGLITTMKGRNLQKTINVINPVLNEYNNTFETVNSVKKSVLTLARKELKLISEGDIEKTKLTETLTQITEDRVPVIEQEIKLLDSQLAELQETIEEYEQKARDSENIIESIKILNNLKNIVSDLETKRETIEGNYINSLVKNGFNISKLSEDIIPFKKMDTVSNIMRDFITCRKVELEPSQDEEELMMLQALDKSQPNPTILRKMINDCMCYVCRKEIDSNSKDWIEKKLIPFFEEKNTNDTVLNNLIHLKGFFSFLNSKNDRNKSLNKTAISEYKIELQGILSELKKANDDVTDYIENHGDPSGNNDGDIINITTYNQAIDDKVKNRIKHGQRIEELNSLNATVKQLEKEIQSDLGNNPKLERIHQLTDLLSDLDKMFSVKKYEIFKQFAAKLEDSATKRFKKFLSRNNVAKNQKVKVELVTKDDTYEFKINVMNEFGTIQSQAGGAQDSLTKLAVVFALLDISKEKQNLGFPFMADAPTSKLSKPQKESFYEQLSTDDALNQTLLMTMDLFDSKENNKNNLNELGLKVLEDITNQDDSSMILLDLVNKDKPQLGVEIKYLKR